MQFMFPTKFPDAGVPASSASGSQRNAVMGELGMVNESVYFPNIRGSPLEVNRSISLKLDFFLKNRKIPHIIFHGPSGTGKRTIVYDFINRIYGYDKQKIKSNVMFVNCSHGKGIKFIREDLKFFAKTNIQSNSGVVFKSIVLMNADFLTIDAQSALRRCIELFSYNTRFFIIVENKHKLLNPILSRFCEIYISEHVCDSRVINLHQYDLRAKMDLQFHSQEKQAWIRSKLPKPDTSASADSSEVVCVPPRDYIDLVDIVVDLYENGISALDLIQFVEASAWFTPETTIEYIAEFYRIKSEYRCEKLLMFYIMDMLYFNNAATSTLSNQT